MNENRRASSVPPALVHRERPSKLYDAQQTDHCCADFAHDTARVTKLIERITAAKARSVVYEPGLRSGFHNDPNGENTLETYTALLTSSGSRRLPINSSS